MWQYYAIKSSITLSYSSSEVDDSRRSGFQEDVDYRTDVADVSCQQHPFFKSYDNVCICIGVLDITRLQYSLFRVNFPGANWECVCVVGG